MYNRPARGNRRRLGPSVYVGPCVPGAATIMAFGATMPSWQFKYSLVYVPLLLYGLLSIGQRFPETERVQANVSTGRMMLEMFQPLFLLWTFCMLLTASTELGTNSFMESILGGLGSAVVVLDADLRVSMWNRAAEDVWGVRSEEVRGKPLMSLDIGLPVDQLMSNLRRCLSGAPVREQTEVEATNRRGRKIRCLVSCSPLMGSGETVQGAILLIDDRSPVPAAGR